MVKRLTGCMIFLLLWGVCVFQGYGLSDFTGQSLMFYRAGKEPGTSRLEAVERGEAQRESQVFFEFSSWRLEREVEVSNKAVGRKKLADCIRVYGNRELAAYTGLDSGTYGFRSDEDGCLISRGLAMELFGSVLVTGRSVWCAGERYVIRGVISDPGYRIQVPMKKEDTGGLPYLLLSDGFDPQLLYRYGFQQADFSVSADLYRSVAGLFLCLPLWAVLGCEVIIYCRERRGEWECLAASFLFFFAVAGSLLFLEKSGMGIWNELVPDQWSDFGFWVELYRRGAKEWNQAGEAIHVPWAAALIGKFISCAVISLVLSAGVAASVLKSSFPVLFHLRGFCDIVTEKNMNMRRK